MKRRSRSIPRPPVGGIPYSRSRQEIASSIGCASYSPCFFFLDLHLERCLWSIESFNSEKPFCEFAAIDVGLEADGIARIGRVELGAGDFDRVTGDVDRLDQVFFGIGIEAFCQDLAKAIKFTVILHADGQR